MADFVDAVLGRIGFSSGAAKALQFMVGLVLAAISVQSYSQTTQALSFIVNSSRWVSINSNFTL